jgi:hypothetical protein
MKIFFIQLLIALSLSVKGAVIEYNANGLLSKYHEYCSDKIILLDSFKAYVNQYYEQDSLGCIRAACQQEDWEFRLTFFAAFSIHRRFPDVNYGLSYEIMFLNISSMVTKNLIKFYPTQEQKDRYFKEMELLLNLCEEAIPKIGGGSYFGTQILTGRFLHQNLAYEYARNTINYDSYFSALQNIQRFLEDPNLMQNLPQDFVNSSTQFIIYSYIIYEQECTQLFEYSGKEHLTHLAVFYILSEVREKKIIGNFCLRPTTLIKKLVNLFTGNVTGKIESFVYRCFATQYGYYQLDPDIKPIIQHGEELLKKPHLWNLEGIISLRKFLNPPTNLDLEVD